MSLCLHLCLCVCVCIYNCLCLYACMFTCLYVCVSMHMCVSNSPHCFNNSRNLRFFKVCLWRCGCDYVCASAYVCMSASAALLMDVPSPNSAPSHASSHCPPSHTSSHGLSFVATIYVDDVIHLCNHAMLASLNSPFAPQSPPRSEPVLFQSHCLNNTLP